MTTYKIISADSHVVEPPNLWLDYIDRHFIDKAPRLVHQPDTDLFYCEGARRLTFHTFASAGMRPEDVKEKGRYHDVIRPGAYDPDARLKDMTQDGVDAEVLYPSVSMTFFTIPDVPFQEACFAAYNSWMADMCKTHPDHLKGIALLSIEDLDHAAQELERSRKLGLVGAMIAIYPQEGEDYGSPHYDKLWAASEALDMPISLHVATHRRSPTKGPMKASEVATRSVWVQRSIGDMIFSGVFERFPRLKVVSAENEIGWAPYFLEKMDHIFIHRRHRHPMNLKGDLLPSQQFHQHVYLTFMRDLAGVRNRDLIGVDNIMWSSDYPHHESTWPHSQEVLAKHFVGVPEVDQRKIVRDNVTRLYHFN